MSQTDSPELVNQEALSFECSTSENFTFYHDFFTHCNPTDDTNGVVDDNFIGSVEDNWFSSFGETISGVFDSIVDKSKIGFGLIIVVAIIILLMLVKGFSNSLENGKLYEATASLLV